jgi:hypothetical protein
MELFSMPLRLYVCNRFHITHLIEKENKTMKKLLIILVGLTLAVVVTTGAAFALTSDGSDTPGEGSEDQVDEPSGDQPTATSIDDIDLNECNWIHNITACEDEVVGSSAVCAEEVPDCNDTLVIGPDEKGTIEPDFGEDGPYLVPDREVECGAEQAVSITSDGEVSCLDLSSTSQTDDGKDMVSPGSHPVVEPAQ